MKTILIENTKKMFPYNFSYRENNNNGNIDDITLYINSIDIDIPKQLIKDISKFRFNNVDKDKNIIYRKDIHLLIPHKYIKIDGKPYNEFFKEKATSFIMEPENNIMTLSLLRDGESFIVKYLHDKTIYENLVKEFDKKLLYDFEEFDENTKIFF